jgi:hypothetical protein
MREPTTASPVYSRDEQARKQENDRTLQAVVALQRRANDEHDEQTIKENAQRTFLGLMVMSWAAFALGVVLIATSLAVFVVQGRTFDALGMGTIGIADVVAVLLYQPMDRLQDADTHYAQQIMMLRGWALTVNLQLRAMVWEDPDSVRATAGNIQSATEEYAKILGQLLSTGTPATSLPATSGTSASGTTTSSGPSSSSPTTTSGSGSAGAPK